MRKKRSKKRIVLYCFMGIAFVICLAMAFSNQIKYKIINYKSEAYTKKIEQISYKTIKDNEGKEATYDLDQVQAVNEEALLQSMLSSGETAHNIVGFITVPSVSVYVTIFQGLDNSNLLYGAGTAKPNQKMGEGNYVLASHRLLDSSLLFSPLDYSSLGDKIYTTNKEKIFEYEIVDKMIVAPTRGDLMDDVEGKKIITLITCSDIYGTARLIIRGELKSVWKYGEAPKNIKQQFTE